MAQQAAVAVLEPGAVVAQEQGGGEPEVVVRARGARRNLLSKLQRWQQTQRVWLCDGRWCGSRWWWASGVSSGCWIGAYCAGALQNNAKALCPHLAKAKKRRGQQFVSALDELINRLASEPAVLVSVARSQGSVPREAGAWMAVLASGVLGTIGGGHLELQAIAAAQARLKVLPKAQPKALEPFETPLKTPFGGLLQADQGHGSPEPFERPVGAQAEVLRYPLGPSLGQCCGGVVFLRYECVQASDRATLAARLRAPAQPLALFGGGHVGKALVQVLGHLPYAVRWVDSRDEIFPSRVPANVQCEHSDPVQAAVRELASGAQVLIMSFSHAEDLDVVAACLQRQRDRADLPYVGLIGSATKWATFQHRLAERGFTPQECAHITCPIGVPGIAGKEPEVIAIAVAAQVLQARVLQPAAVA